MFLDKLLESNSKERYRRLEKRLLGLQRDIRPFRRLTVPALYEMEQVLEQRLDDHKAKDLKFVIENVAYQKDLMALKAVRIMRDIKETRDAADVVVPGRTYYRDVVVEGNTIKGRRAQYIAEGSASDWFKFQDDVRVMKIMEVMEYGSEADFRTLYVEMADGRPFESTVHYLPEHITKSSEAALKRMAAFCESRWEGPWPWQTRTPMKVFNIIKEARMTRLEEIRKQLAESRRSVNEGEVERANLVVRISGIKDKVASTVQSFGKISGDFLTMGEEVAAELGPDAKAKLDSMSTDALRKLIDELNQFMRSVDEVLATVSGDTSVGETPSDMGMGMGGDEGSVEFDQPTDEIPGDEFGDDESPEAGMGSDLDMDNVMGGGEEDDLGGLGGERELR